MERPRQKGHGDYATNVALQLAKRPGTNPRALAELLAGAAPRGRGHRRGRDRRPRVPQHHRRGRQRRGRWRPRSWPPARRTARSTLFAGREDQPRVRLGQPDRAHPHRRRPVGSRRRRARPDLHDDRRRGHPGVLLQRPRRPDRPVRQLAARRGPGPARRPRTATAASTSARSPRPSSRKRPDVARPARRRGAGGLPGRRASSMMFAEIKAEPARLRRRLRRLLPRGRPARSRRGRAGDRAAHRARATPTRRTARCGCATEKFGDDKDRVIIKSDGEGAYLVR